MCAIDKIEGHMIDVSAELQALRDAIDARDAARIWAAAQAVHRSADAARGWSLDLLNSVDVPEVAA